MKFRLQWFATSDRTSAGLLQTYSFLNLPRLKSSEWCIDFYTRSHAALNEISGLKIHSNKMTKTCPGSHVKSAQWLTDTVPKMATVPILGMDICTWDGNKSLNLANVNIWHGTVGNPLRIRVCIQIWQCKTAISPWAYLNHSLWVETQCILTSLCENTRYYLLKQTLELSIICSDLLF